MRPGPGKSNGPKRLPEDVQSVWRSRLKFLRQSRRLSKEDIRTVTSGTVNQYEQHDMSSFRLGDMYSLANELGMNITDFCSYLFEGTRNEAFEQENRTLNRVLLYMRNLPAERQELAADLVQRIMSFTIEEERVKIQANAGRRDSRHELEVQVGGGF